jgi:hypothetical protein
VKVEIEFVSGHRLPDEKRFGAVEEWPAVSLLKDSGDFLR